MTKLHDLTVPVTIFSSKYCDTVKFTLFSDDLPTRSKYQYLSPACKFVSSPETHFDAQDIDHFPFFPRCPNKIDIDVYLSLALSKEINANGRKVWDL
jgi:hypothetical protein